MSTHSQDSRLSPPTGIGEPAATRSDDREVRAADWIGPERRKSENSAQPVASVILPTYNEAENIEDVVGRIQTALCEIDHEILIVDDDSPDETWRVASAVSDASTARNSTINVIRRVTEKGLSSAVLAGMSVAQGQVLVVMDADLQHDERKLPALIEAIQAGSDISVGSRNADGGSYGDFSKHRLAISFAGAQMAKILLGIPVSDPMSGYFALSQDYYQRTVAHVNPRGFKILLEFVARGDRPSVSEVAYEFRSRVRGSTKLTGSVLASYLLALIELTAGRFVSATFTAYALVGLTGLCIRLASSQFLESAVEPNLAALLAFELSVVWNYVFNNGLTFSSKRHSTTGESIRGLVLFHLVSAQGLLVQAGVTSYLSTNPDAPVWSTAVGWLPLTVGIAAATVGNYFLNSHLTWPERSRFSERQ